MTRPRFHLAFPVHDLELARDFYVGVLDAKAGRESDQWIDFDLYGHLVVAHLAPEECALAATFGGKSLVDDQRVPVRGFGVILDWREWGALAAKLKGADVKFMMEPAIRFAGKAGEHGSFFVLDPSGNALEFKTFKHDAMVFEKEAAPKAAPATLPADLDPDSNSGAETAETVEAVEDER